ncbi:Uncharacterized protein TPAR_04676 [Tolypocladium paradoxum]|uniref:Zn(2)-C6 fungal-type domain-containing protein n=1 Tax=Tolypocladium paradoxum TaxID=94208 RepID=A0A2S4KY90_9HYPO|nr:Uncharacterized protein TPAR_04676 [Tolypocladium paradoxum]
MSEDGENWRLSPAAGSCSTQSSGSHDDKETPGVQERDTAESEEPLKAPRRKPIPGKGHRKSRKGCFNCKRRRVKCSEVRPECHCCRRMGLVCVYPASPSPMTECSSLSACPKSNLNLDHLRFFHHFLVEAHPPLPYGASAVWHNVAALSHQVGPRPTPVPTKGRHEFLANALLGLGAQHLTLFSQTDYSIQALDIRVSAINGLNEALSQPCLSATDGDARYAAIVALTYQSSYMPDAMMDFLGMMRGWMVISTTLIPDPETSIFRGFTRDSFVSSMRRHIGNQTHLNNHIMIDDFLASLRIVRPLCQAIAELRYLSALERLARLVKASPLDAFLDLVPCYALTNKMTEDEFRGFIDPANYTARVLLAHFLVLDYVLHAHFSGSTDKHFAFCKQITRAWVLRIGASLPARFQMFMMWPLGLAREVIRT